MKILIVEDEVYSRQSLHKQVEEFCRTGSAAPCEILEAVNGKEGWEAFQREEPEVVLSDIKMPFISGLELLERIFRKNTGAQVVMVSGYADFDFARESLNHGAAAYLLKPVDDGELESCLSKILRRNAQQKQVQEQLVFLREKDALTQYLYNSVLSDMPERDFVNEKVFQKVFSTYLLAGVYFSGGAYPQRESFYAGLQGICEGEGRTQFRLLVFSQQLWGVVVKENQSCLNILNRVEGLLQEAGSDYAIGVSASQSGAPTLKKAYQQALKALKSKIFYPQRLLFFSQVSARRREKYIPEGRQVELLRIYLEKGDADGARGSVKDILDGMLEVRGLTVSSVENGLMLLTTVFHETLAKFSPDQELSQYRLEFDLLSYHGGEEILQAALGRVEFVCECVQRERKGTAPHGESIVDTVLEYIGHNYNQELSLRDLAENVFYLNHTYLSHLIREKTGKNYSSYLREVRLCRAKEFLKNEKLSVTQVATLSGYNDTSQFIQIFRKEVGVTPKKFRDLLAENPENRGNRKQH